jgi:hypothetical protein
MRIPKKIEFPTNDVETDLLEEVLIEEETKGFKKSFSFIKIFNLGLKSYLRKRKE